MLTFKLKDTDTCSGKILIASKCFPPNTRATLNKQINCSRNATCT